MLIRLLTWAKVQIEARFDVGLGGELRKTAVTKDPKGEEEEEEGGEGRRRGMAMEEKIGGDSKRVGVQRHLIDRKQMMAQRPPKFHLPPIALAVSQNK